MDMELEQVAVKTNFLYGEFEEKIYMRQPEVYVQGHVDKVCLLRNSFFDLKQSTRPWYKRFDAFILKKG